MRCKQYNLKLNHVQEELDYEPASFHYHLFE
jgi:hypothetical protein